MTRVLRDLRTHEYLLNCFICNDFGDARKELINRLNTGDDALRLLKEITNIAEDMNEHIARYGEGAFNGVRNRVQAIHGLAVTPEVEKWGAA